MRSLSRLGACWIWLAAALTNAQTTTAELAGSVTDPSGAALSKARIVATNSGTGLTYDATTDESGNYLITLLPPGTYNLSVEAPGFRRTVQNNVTLEVSQHAEWLLNGALSGPMSAEHATQIDHIEHIYSKVASVVMHRLDQLFRGESR